MVTIRTAKADDAARVLEMATAFIGATSYRSITPDKDVLAHRIAGFLSGTVGKLFVADKDGRVIGMLAAVVYPHMLTGLLQGSEVVWWVDEDQRKTGAGLQLLTAAEAWYRTMGAETSHIVSWGDERLDRLYPRLGYRELERVYVKVLGGR